MENLYISQLTRKQIETKISNIENSSITYYIYAGSTDIIGNPYDVIAEEIINRETNTSAIIYDYSTPENLYNIKHITVNTEYSYNYFFELDVYSRDYNYWLSKPTNNVRLLIADNKIIFITDYFRFIEETIDNCQVYTEFLESKQLEFLFNTCWKSNWKVSNNASTILQNIRIEKYEILEDKPLTIKYYLSEPIDIPSYFCLISTITINYETIGDTRTFSFD